MADAKLNREEEAEVERKRQRHRAQQPYASELDDRDLEHAHKENRPVDGEGEAGSSQPRGATAR